MKLGNVTSFIAASLALSIATASLANASPIDDAEAAYYKDDFATAVTLYKILASQGNSRAMWRLGSLYESGEGVPQSYVDAIKWYRLSAERGDHDGLWSLGAMYEQGLAVPQNSMKAYMWFNLAISVKAPKGPYDLRKAEAMFRDRSASKLTPEALAQAQALSVQCAASNYKNCD